jgi:hypothetical protein
MVGFIGPRGKSGGVSTRVGMQVCKCVVCDNDKRCCAFAGRSDHEDLNMGGMVGWFGVFTSFVR